MRSMKSLNRADQQNHCQGLYDKLITILKTNKMNLKNLNVAELNAQELKETEGGSGPGTGYGTVNPGDWKMVAHAAGDFIRGFLSGF